MWLPKVGFIIPFLFIICTGSAQRIMYSEPEKEDTRRMEFEVIGKVAGNFLIYKNSRGKSFISVYNNEMKQVTKVEHDYIPDERLINVDFFPYADHAYMIYQYQRKSVVYCQAVQIDGMGQKMSDIIQLDTTHIGFTNSNKIYSAISSEDKNQLMVFKINSRNRERYIITTLLFDNAITLKKRSTIALDMEEREDRLNEFSLDNDGDLIFAKYSRNNSEHAPKTYLVWKPAMGDSMIITDLGIEKIFLDEPRIKVDNANKRYFLTSFYNKQRRGNIEGFYFHVWDKLSQRSAMQNTVALSDELRREARSEGNLKTAFNDYFIRNIIVKKDGGFIIGSESYYTTSRMNNWNRWDYLLGSPFNSAYNYYSYSPFYNTWYWRNRFNSSQPVRHHADNVTILAFDKAGKLEWSNVINKEQFDDESDDRISYLLLNTGGQLHFVFNHEEKRQRLLNDFAVTADGQINRNPTLKNLDKGYEFLPKYGKQVSSRQVIIPCYYRNYICFAKIDYNS